MFWKKNQKEIPHLPDLPLNPAEHSQFNEQYPEDQEQIHSLPSFPDSPMKRGFSQSMIKNAIETEEVEENLPLLPSFENESFAKPSNKTMEMEEWTPQNPPMQISQMNMPKHSSEKKPIFIRLDKFQGARESLEIIKEKLGEMDELLKMIKEVKMKEDQEINQWEKEIETIKSRLNSITSEIFDSSY